MNSLSDISLESLKDLSQEITQKDSFYLTFTSNKTIFTTKFKTPKKLLSNKKYEAALHNFTTSNYQTNITEKNNKFSYAYRKDTSTPFVAYEIIFEKGAYEITEINTEIIRVLKERRHWETDCLSIGVKLSTFKSTIEITTDKLFVDFRDENSIRTLLGFDSRTLSKGYHISTNTIQITNSTLILIKCSIVEGSYHNGESSNVLFSIPSYLVPVGFKLNIIPPNMIYLPINTNILNSITFEICDDQNNILDFKDENIGISLHIRQV